MSRLTQLSLRAKLASAFGLTLVLLLVAAVVAVTKMSTLASHTADAKQGAVLDEQIMSMEIAAREALAIEANTILYGPGAGLEAQLDAAWKSNDGDAFPESLVEATRVAVLDMPNRLGDDEAAGKAVKDSVARTIAFVRQGNLDAARSNRLRTTIPAFDSFLKKNHAVETQSEEFSEAASTDAAAGAAGGKRMIVLVTLVAVLLAAACAFVITRGVAAILERLASLKNHDTTELARGLAAVATGDLTHSVTP